jgi:hypothetical protein
VTTGSGPHDQYGVGDQVMSGLQPLPANLVLSGSITVPAFLDLNASPDSTPPNGWYQFGSNSSWGTALGSLTGAGVTHSVGPATFSWNLTPTFLAPVKPMCEVPDLRARQAHGRDAGAAHGWLPPRQGDPTPVIPAACAP